MISSSILFPLDSKAVALNMPVDHYFVLIASAYVAPDFPPPMIEDRDHATEINLTLHHVNPLEKQSFTTNYTFCKWGGELPIVAHCRDTSSLAIYNSTERGLQLVWNNILNVPVGDPNDVSQWNTWFDLPINGTPFTSASVDGDTVYLFGGSDIIFAVNKFKGNDAISKIRDYEAAVIELRDSSFAFAGGFTQGQFPAVTIVGDGVFDSCAALQLLELPAVTALGTSIGDNGVFQNIIGNVITLTIPVAIDGDTDVTTLQSNNTVTLITV